MCIGASTSPPHPNARHAPAEAGHSSSDPAGSYSENILAKKFFTVEPTEFAVSFTFRQVLLASGSAALPDSLSFSPVYLAPSTTVLPIPLAVSSTPSPTLPSPIFLAPVSTWPVAALTLESSAAAASPAGASRATMLSTTINRFMGDLPGPPRGPGFILPAAETMSGDRLGEGKASGRTTKTGERPAGVGWSLAGVAARPHAARVRVAIPRVALLILIETVEGAGTEHARLQDLRRRVLRPHSAGLPMAGRNGRPRRRRHEAGLWRHRRHPDRRRSRRLQPGRLHPPFELAGRPGEHGRHQRRRRDQCHRHRGEPPGIRRAHRSATLPLGAAAIVPLL